MTSVTQEKTADKSLNNGYVEDFGKHHSSIVISSLGASEIICAPSTPTEELHKKFDIDLSGIDIPEYYPQFPEFTQKTTDTLISPPSFSEMTHERMRYTQHPWANPAVVGYNPYLMRTLHRTEKAEDYWYKHIGIELGSHSRGETEERLALQYDDCQKYIQSSIGMSRRYYRKFCQYKHAYYPTTEQTRAFPFYKKDGKDIIMPFSQISFLASYIYRKASNQWMYRERVDEGIYTEYPPASKFGELLSGSPGLGKTIFAACLAAQLGVPFVRFRCSEGYPVTADTFMFYQGLEASTTKARISDVAYAYQFGGVVLLDEIQSSHGLDFLMEITDPIKDTFMFQETADMEMSGKELVRHPAFFLLVCGNKAEDMEGEGNKRFLVSGNLNDRFVNMPALPGRSDNRIAGIKELFYTESKFQYVDGASNFRTDDFGYIICNLMGALNNKNPSNRSSVIFRKEYLSQDIEFRSLETFTNAPDLETAIQGLPYQSRLSEDERQVAVANVWSTLVALADNLISHNQEEDFVSDKTKNAIKAMFLEMKQRLADPIYGYVNIYKGRHSRKQSSGKHGKGENHETFEDGSPQNKLQEIVHSRWIDELKKKK